MLRRLPLALLVVSACGAASPLLELPAEVRPPPTGAAGPAGTPAVFESAGPGVTAPVPSAPSGPAPDMAPAGSAVEAPKMAVTVLLEPPYSALGHARLGSEMATLARDEELFQWALGGSSDPAHPSNRPGYHPATRVVIDVELLSRAPKGSTARLLRLARSHGYWPLRACFETAQRLLAKTERRAKVRLTLGASGKVLGARSLGPMAEREYARCVLDRVRGLDFTPGFTRKLDIEVNVQQWPGHAPVPPRAPDGSPAVHLSHEALASLEGLTPMFGACYEKGLAIDPKLWGRIALKLELGPEGAVKRATPVETDFPNAGVTECVRQALLSARLVSQGTSELTFAVRLGQPAPPTPPEPSPPLGEPLAPAGAPLAPPPDSPPAPPAPVH
jgi:hypothetical protein